ncbi:hypothetical protein MRP26_20480 [Bacillus sp. CCB-MMP212]|uniref:hypothetical protein n=1 Tax=Bacillus sp. CCB-MMP212 TaxID=2928002 RepID=UPI001F610D6C|nr:hypothetical protein [Bacillus sp. CCB-MMP212]MCI4251325.1 hypothetical protein [Bacillus sp. CCB-MMP212]
MVISCIVFKTKSTWKEVQQDELPAKVKENLLRNNKKDLALKVKSFSVFKILF